MNEDKCLIKTNKLCLANGDEFDKTEFEVDTDILAGFIKVKTEGKTIYVNPEFIISFEESNLSRVKIFEDSNGVHESGEPGITCPQKYCP